jgi:hypothetical protein
MAMTAMDCTMAIAMAMDGTTVTAMEGGMATQQQEQQWMTQ